MDITFVLVAMLGVLLTGIAKSGFAGGVGVVAVPMMAPFIGGAEAIGILLPVLLLMDLLTLRVFRRQLSWALFRPLLPGIVVGIVLGSLLLGVVSERGIQALIGLMGFWVLAQRRWPWLAGRGVNLQGAAAFSLGGIGGVGSTLAHAGAAPLQTYYLLQGLDKERFLAQVSLAVACMNAIKLVPYGALGLLEFTLSPLLLVLLPLAWLGVQIGRWLSRKIDGELFFRIMMWLLALNSLWLLGQAVVG